MASVEQVTADILVPVSDWYESKRTKTGKVNTNVMNVGLILTEHMAEGVPLTPEIYRATSQVKGLSGERIAKILAAHGEERPFTREGGRTSRQTLPYADELAAILSTAAAGTGYSDLTDHQQASVRRRLQSWFVERVRLDFFAAKRVEAVLDPTRAVRANIAALLVAAAGKGGNTAGAVAQHLVGAKLVLRFPGTEVDNHAYTTADQQLSRPGDFFIGDTAIHVTTAPGDALFAKCRQNIADGYRPVVLVPAARLVAGQQLAENSGLSEKTSVQAIEDFIGTNVEEVSEFTAEGVRKNLRGLLEVYNERVAAIEPDPALLIRIPNNL